MWDADANGKGAFSVLSDCEIFANLRLKLYLVLLGVVEGLRTQQALHIRVCREPANINVTKALSNIFLNTYPPPTYLLAGGGGDGSLRGSRMPGLGLVHTGRLDADLDPYPPLIVVLYLTLKLGTQCTN